MQRILSGTNTIDPERCENTGVLLHTYSVLFYVIITIIT